MDEVVVTAQRRAAPRLEVSGNIQRLDAQTLERSASQHPSELMSRVAGAWIVRGSGQEHQTALRSPVLGGAGACGGVLFLEDGIPVRPAGFCNINQMAELATELAGAVEVIRGPGNALQGANAVHGVVNVLMPLAGSQARSRASLEAGVHGYYRARAVLPLQPDARWMASAAWTKDGGFRDGSAYRQGKLHARREFDLQDGDFSLALTATRLRQATAGFIYGEGAYRDEGLSRTNPTPGAFRDMDAQRFYGIWRRELPGLQLDVRPYLRHSSMSFQHHALPGQPVETNGHTSAGALSAALFERAGYSLTIGLDAEWSTMFLRQVQEGLAEGPPRVRETRPPGRHYDYQVTSLGFAPFIQAEYRPSQRWTVAAGLRLEYQRYQYDNRMPDGDTREDGSRCGFGGCVYTRPADRSDDFSEAAPTLAVSRQLARGSSLFASLSRGFRMPQTTELYRLQNGQLLPDLRPEQIDGLEIGWRAVHDRWSADLAAFAMRKRDSAFRDAEGYNVSGARSRHRGIEFSLDWQAADAWWLAVNGSHALHSYDFDYSAGRGESFEDGKEMDSAPRWLGSAEIRYQPLDRVDLGLQWVHVGSYFLDPANLHTYGGHDLLNMRAGLQISANLSLTLRLNNLANRRIADRADYGGGDYRYLPGRGREWFLEMRLWD